VLFLKSFTPRLSYLGESALVRTILQTQSEAIETLAFVRLSQIRDPNFRKPKEARMPKPEVGVCHALVRISEDSDFGLTGIKARDWHEYGSQPPDALVRFGFYYTASCREYTASS
jgi:hypothetical protein